MRENKFRAWDEQRKVMHFDFQFIKSGEEGNDWIIFTSDRQPLGWEEIRIEGKPHPFNNPYFAQQLKIMQYTGLKDCKGREIYEGDIISYPDTESDYVDVGIGVGLKCAEMSCYGFAPVVFALGTFGLDCDGGESLGRGFHSFEWITDTYGFTFKELEVIGNIYENPELMEMK